VVRDLLMIALCLGGARSVWADLAAARDLTRNTSTLVVACNFAGIHYDGRLDAYCTLHPERFRPWREERAAGGLNTDYRAIVHAPHRQVPDAEIVPHGWYGSSGLYMAQVALQHMGARGAILCGVPMEAEGMHIHWPGEWGHTARYRAGFEAAKAEGANIRSMSGWTAQLLGRPDEAWLSEVR
jgi:hypothetical protein